MNSFFLVIRLISASYRDKNLSHHCNALTTISCHRCVNSCNARSRHRNMMYFWRQICAVYTNICCRQRWPKYFLQSAFPAPWEHIVPGAVFADGHYETLLARHNIEFNFSVLVLNISNASKIESVPSKYLAYICCLWLREAPHCHCGFNIYIYICSEHWDAKYHGDNCQLCNSRWQQMSELNSAALGRETSNQESG